MASVVIALRVSTIIFGGIHWISKVSEKGLLWLLPVSLRLSRIIALHLDHLLPALKFGLFGCFYRDCYGGFLQENGQNGYPKGVARGVF